ncbi:ABC transporter substrate-binding protein [Thermostaphylospora chromogena]|uniref:Monosaccharide ABC transporter substrate-binding protein, CUT2 family n=1 Tax=Thermostaphylospora chromogena TaxID=35622 RepID=A0A1H1A1F8_9ACTN|nr:ABC transporter substrate-binding protein [Thermostaphylospora chromogena]SDQ33498.1 monosaccharide ABC transporter substrate-binding protein, CUT2 family [Thermostaphylospora chromogena]
MRNTSPRPGRRLRAAALACAAVLVAAGCAKSEENAAAPQPEGTQGAQVVATPTGTSGSTCSLEQFGGEKFDLKNAVVGFSQSEKEANPFRIAETQSIRDEAAKLGIDELRVTNAQSQFSKQITDVQQLIAQGAQLLVIAPLNSDGWEPVLQQAAEKKIPIITIDRKINAEPCKDYLTFIGSDFYEQGKRAADQMIEALGGKGKVAILLGAPGNNVTTERTNGFKDRVKEKAPDIEISFEQTGEFAREKGQQVTEQLIQSNPDINGIYAENDEMALGAVTALKGAGKEPGEIKIVSVDGTRSAVQAIVDGWIHAVVESNPRFGPLAFETAQKFLDGEPIPDTVIISDREYDSSNAESSLSQAY